MVEQFEDEQRIMPMFLIEDKDGRLIVIATPWTDQHEKQASVNYVKTKMRELGATRYVHIAEVWSLVCSEVPESYKQGASLATHPDRREAVIAMAEDKEGNRFQLCRYILRPEHGKATLSPAEITDLSAHRTEGIFTHLLQD